jgi:branched-chain amino acid transport system substrate-binding protein
MPEDPSEISHYQSPYLHPQSIGAPMKQLKVLALCVAAIALSARADVTVGVIYSATGPVAATGIVQQRTISILPKTLGGHKATYVGLDDGGDTTATVKAARKLLSDDKIDVLLGPTSSNNSVAILGLMAAGETPLISNAGTSSIVEPVDGPRRWAFKTTQSEAVMGSMLVQHMLQSGVKRLGIIAFNDAYGEGWLKEVTKLADQRGIKVVSVERYERGDSSTTGQVLKTFAANPDAVFIAAVGSPGVLPQVGLAERGYKGKIYQTHGIANDDFIKLGGKAVEGTFVPLAPVLVAEDLPDSHPAKKASLEFIARYEAMPGAGARSPFAAYWWDGALILDRAVRVAEKTAKPGTVEFRRALRDAIEGVKEVPATNGVFTMSGTDHNGLDDRGRVMTQIRDGKWTLVK